MARKQQDEVLARQSENPVELDSDGQTRRPKKIVLKLDEQGAIDWSAVSDAHIERLSQAARSDPAMREILKTDAIPDAATPVNLIEPRHIHSLLEIFGVVERIAFPVVLKRKYKIALDPVVVDRCFRFSAEQKEQIGQPGATTLNMLPERARGWVIAATCPSEFATLLGEAIKQQFENAMQMQAAMVLQKKRPPNGGIPVAEQQEPAA